jgi:hypothetical protein
MALHFVGFKDDRYWNAVRIWGAPDFLHRNYDRRAWQEIVEGDVAVFAEGRTPIRDQSWDDSQQDIFARGGKGMVGL